MDNGGSIKTMLTANRTTIGYPVYTRTRPLGQTGPFGLPIPGKIALIVLISLAVGATAGYLIAQN